jgi:hypothetical protein
LLTGPLAVGSYHDLVDTAYRIGKPDEGKVRPIKVEVIKTDTVQRIMKNRANLKGTPHYMKPDLSLEELAARRAKAQTKDSNESQSRLEETVSPRRGSQSQSKPAATAPLPPMNRAPRKRVAGRTTNTHPNKAPRLRMTNRGTTKS